MTEQYFEEEEFTTQFTRKTTLRIVQLSKPHWKWVLGFLLMITLVSVLDSYFTFLTSLIIDQAILGDDIEALKNIIIRYGLLILVQAAGVFGFIYLAGILGERIRYDLRKKMFVHLQELSLSYYNVTPVGWIMSRVTSDSERVAELVTWGFLDVTWGIMNIATAAFFMLMINWQLALIVFLAIPILLFVAAQFKKKIIIEFRDVQRINSKITGAFNETITGVRVIKAFGREEHNMQEFDVLTSEMYRAGYRAAWLSALFLPVVMLI
ncbi:MAG: ABC transporter transmembrane domain-containing protein, partial [Bacteroidota bacterium]|nr:ABC transporter transmembrane domain-containing protein [Bacteroidota bacterium]